MIYRVCFTVARILAIDASRARTRRRSDVPGSRRVAALIVRVALIAAALLAGLALRSALAMP
jgi:hypothetical protein